jgi:pyruvate formate-lyase/glycerol dehydratase family glycyl radical enzyme
MKVGAFQLSYKNKNSPRVNNLRLKALNAKPSICIERAEFFTESYKQTEDKHPYLRKAFAFKNLLEKMTIYINEGELIVGNNSCTPRASVVAPEYSSRWISKEINDPYKSPDNRLQDRHEISGQTKNLLTNEIIPYWLGRTVEDRVLEKLPQEIIDVTVSSISKFEGLPIAPECYLRNGIGHVVVDYAILLKKGINGMLEDIKRKLSELEVLNPDNRVKEIFYKSLIIEYEAIKNWIIRFSKLAKIYATKEKNSIRKIELLNISKNCEFIVMNPPKTFWQALQMTFFTQIILFGLEQNNAAVSLGRMDQYLYKYYEEDIKNKSITKEEVLELIECFFIKLSEMSILWDYDNASYYSGFSLTQCVTVGGIDSNGIDITNELSFLILEADKNTGLLQPETAVRVHPDSKISLLAEALKCVKLGRGKPKFFMDGSAVKMLQNAGISLEDARNYSIVGCVELSPTGNTAGYTGAVFINIAKCLEIALNNGKCFITDKEIGLRTGKPDELSSYEKVMIAFKTQLTFFLKNAVAVMNEIIKAHAELYPCQFTSSLIHGCLENGVDFTEGGSDYNFIGVSGVGIPNVANSLAAIKKFVFEEKKISIDELVKILKNNFKNNEKLRLKLWHRMPKYGNDDDFVDLIAKEVGCYYCNELKKFRGPYGNIFRPGLFAVSINVPFGLYTGATAEGRRALKPLADGGISPVAGTERNGIIGVIKSACKIDNPLATNGTLLNLRLSPNIFERDYEISKIISLLKSYNELGGYHIQFNVIDSDVLRKAQQSPEDFKGLMIRVAGYSAYFIELNPEVQEDIISRTIHESLA